MFYIRHRKLAAILRFGFHFCNSSNYFLTTSKSNSTWKWQSYNDFGGEKKKKKKKGQRGSKLFARPAETLCKFLSSDTRKTLNQKRAAVTCQTCRNPLPPKKEKTQVHYGPTVSFLYYVSTVTVSSLTACGIGVCWVYFLIFSAWLELAADFFLTVKRKKKKTGDGVIEPAELQVFMRIPFRCKAQQ